MPYEDTSSLLADTSRSLIEIYLDLQRHYEHIYGPNTVILMEVGSSAQVNIALSSVMKSVIGTETLSTIARKYVLGLSTDALDKYPLSRV